MIPLKLMVPAAFLVVLLPACSDTAPPADKAASNMPAPTSERPSQPPTNAVAPQGAAPVASSADVELSRKVKQTLDAGQGSNAIPSSGHVEVAAASGVVTLYGTVDAVSEKERAALIAMGVEGVRSVVNNLVVVQGS